MAGETILEDRAKHHEPCSNPVEDILTGVSRNEEQPSWKQALARRPSHDRDLAHGAEGLPEMGLVQIRSPPNRYPFGARAFFSASTPDSGTGIAADERLA